MRTLEIKDNFCVREDSNWSNIISEEKFKEKFKEKSPSIKGLFGIPLVFPNNLTTKKNVHLFSIKGTSSEIDLDEFLKEEGSALRIEKREGDNYFVKTGNYIGVLYHEGIKVEITSRFGVAFLQRMINFVNDIYLPNIIVSAVKEGKSKDQFKFILAQLFIQSLGRASALFGLPKSYQRKAQKSFTVIGNIDINHFINYNIPLRQKLKSHSKEQLPVQDIVDVLHKAISIIDKIFSESIVSRIKNIKTELQIRNSNKYVGKHTIRRAKNHKILVHPSYNAYKKVLNYAEMIINNFALAEEEKGKKETTAYLVNVAELFEIYLAKLLIKGLSNDWAINTKQKYPTYENGDNSFLKRELRPDIVLENARTIMVFDVKYKRMRFENWNRNREDFFQIHTYMAYLHYLTKNKKLVGGLLYPIEENKENEMISGNSWFGQNSEFIVYGIDLKKENLTKAEAGFISQIMDIDS